MADEIVAPESLTELEQAQFEAAQAAVTLHNTQLQLLQTQFQMTQGNLQAAQEKLRKLTEAVNIAHPSLSFNPMTNTFGPNPGYQVK